MPSRFHPDVFWPHDSCKLFVADPQFEIIPYDSAVYRAGFDLYSQRPDKDWSLTDCISFAVMTERKLMDAVTADHHFEQAGFRAIFKN
jgi:predicted nucleic acid-binding protein